MLSSMVAACPGYTRNAEESKTPCTQILTSDELAAWERHVL